MIREIIVKVALSVLTVNQNQYRFVTV